MTRLPSSRAVAVMPASAGVILHRALHLKNVMHMRGEVTREASNRVELVHVNATGVGVIEIITNMKIDNLAEHQAMWAMAHRQNLHDPTLHADRGFSDPRRLDLHTRSCGETSQGKLISVWRI